MKSKLLFATASLLGALAIAWMAVDFIGSNTLALAVTLVIAFVYGMGLLELVQFRSATASLRAALAGLDNAAEPALDSWLHQLHPSLANAVAQRIEGERVGLPAPVFSPYLTGLLVMLGLLGTFVGMVDTLHGAVTALEGSTELGAIRAGLAAPIEGLGLAFGTSVAGVAASAMLGLNTTLSRRERILATRELDHHIGATFRQHSLAYNRNQTYRAMQQQSELLPQVAQQLSTLANGLESMGQTLGAQLLDNQQRFNDEAREQYSALAESVGKSLRESLGDSGRLAGESIAPVIEQAMAQVTAGAEATHEQLRSTSASHLDAVSRQLQEHGTTVLSELGRAGESLAANAREESAAMVAEIGRLLASTEALVQQRAENEAGWLQEQGQRMEALTAALREELAALREAEATRSRMLADELGKLQTGTQEQLHEINLAATQQLQGIQQGSAESLGAIQASTLERLAQLQGDTADNLHRLQDSTQQQLTKLQGDTAHNLNSLQHSTQEHLTELQSSATEQLASLQAGAAQQLASLGRELEQPMTRLIETASETPKAAAEVISKLRDEVSKNIERDNSLLEERKQILSDLAALSGSLQKSSEAQQQALAELVASTSGTLHSVTQEFRTQLSDETSRLSEITATAAGSTADIAGLGESFSVAVQLFNDSNNHLVENLSRIEQSMSASTERSDEQMGYYVAQAREIIDQSMLSQREIIEELRRLGQTGDLFAAEAG